MNIKTSYFLAFLVIAGGCLFLLTQARTQRQAAPAAAVADAGTQRILKQELKPDDILQIDIQRGDKHVILHKAGSGWALPGNWPIRKDQVKELVKTLTDLRSRFVSLPVSGKDKLAGYGLAEPRVTVTLRVRTDKEPHDYRLALGEEAGVRFSPTTYLQLSELQDGKWVTKPEVVRLAPGIVAMLSRPEDYYQQRRLFPYERVEEKSVGPGATVTRIEKLKARRLTVKAPPPAIPIMGVLAAPAANSVFALATRPLALGPGFPVASDWQMYEPTHDRLDPDKLQALLRAVPDIWAERFVDKPYNLSGWGLQPPRKVLKVESVDGQPTTLLIGDEAEYKETKQVTETMPAMQPGMEPRSFTRDVDVKFLYAKLHGNDQVFLIKADTLKDVFVKTEEIRDAQLARFQAGDVKKIKVDFAGKSLTLAWENDKWRLKEPIDSPAELNKVNELLDKLSGLEARGADVLDNAEAKKYRLDPPAGTVTLTIDEKDKKTRTITFVLGKHDDKTKKLYVQVAGWPRINAVDDSLLKLVERPALAYRGRGLFDFAAADIDRIELAGPNQTLVFKKDKDDWRLEKPVKMGADAGKIDQLLADLGQLSAVEYITNSPKPEDLDQIYGLGKDALSATVHFSNGKKPAQTLLVGKQRPGKTDFFAKLGDGPAVFAVGKNVRDHLGHDALAYLPLQLWRVPLQTITEVSVQPEGAPAYTVKAADQGWSLTGPFDAKLAAPVAVPFLAVLAAVDCERYETLSPKDPQEYGLDKPYLKLSVTGKEGKKHTLQVGKPTAKGAASRYASLDDGKAIFVLGERFLKAADRNALALLDPQLLASEPKNLVSISSKLGDKGYVLEQKSDGWKVQAGAHTFTPDKQAIEAIVKLCSNLRAASFADYGPKADLARFGLDKADVHVTITVKDSEGKESKHTLALGKKVPGPMAGRFAWLKEKSGVVVLSPADAVLLARTYLDYVDHGLLQFPASQLKSITRKMGDQELKLARGDEGWKMEKPAAQAADGRSLDQLADQLASLRALRIAAYPAKEVKSFGLDDPAAVLSLQLGDGKTQTLKLGEVAEGSTSGDRYAQVEGASAVAVLPGDLVRKLVARPLQFRDRTIIKFAGADRVAMTRPGRKAVFASIDGIWKMTEPVPAEAEQTDLDDFINALATLRAARLVKEKPTADDLQKWGLDKLEVRWQLQSSGNDVLDLEIGAQEKIKGKPGPRCYAKLAKGNLVFLLDAKLTERALAEYRSRTLWEPLDAVQANYLSFQYAKKPFALEKGEAIWKVKDNPELVVNAKAVSDTLAVLGNLRALRTVADKEADLKLYGLEPPRLILEVRTRTGNKRILQIGNAEGESKRLYARVPDGKRGDVIVLSEADSAALLRTLPALTQKVPGEKMP